MGCLKDASSTKETKQTEKAQPGGARDSIEKAINVTGVFFVVRLVSNLYSSDLPLSLPSSWSHKCTSISSRSNEKIVFSRKKEHLENAKSP
jgi:hypothetical protein